MKIKNPALKNTIFGFENKIKLTLKAPKITTPKIILTPATRKTLNTTHSMIFHDQN